jgi:hypothetical protein
VFAARGTIFNLANGPPRLARRLHGSRRRQSSPRTTLGQRTAGRPSPSLRDIAAALLAPRQANPEPYPHTAVARMIDQASGSDDGPYRRLASVA